jgi:hypothetical protein
VLDSVNSRGRVGAIWTSLKVPNVQKCPIFSGWPDFES